MGALDVMGWTEPMTAPEVFVRDDHPVDRFVVSVEGEASATVISVMQEAAQELADRRTWVLGPPCFIDQSDERWVGFGLSIYTALPPWGADLDPAVDRSHLEEVKELVGEVCRISGAYDVSFQVEYAGELVGTVEHGRMDSGVEVTLIGEWERVIDSASR